MALARCSRLSLPLFLSRPLLFSSSSALYSRFPLPFFLSRHLLFSSSFALCRRALPLTCLDIPLAAARFTPLPCQVRWSGDSAYSPLNSGGGGSQDSDFTWTEPDENWPFPGFWWNALAHPHGQARGEGTTKEQMIDYYIKTLAKVVGSEEEAKKKIYNVYCEDFFGFGCEIDKETVDKLAGLPGFIVSFDSYVDVENKDYGGELLVNGEIVQRSPVPQKAQYKAELVTKGEPKVQGKGCWFERVSYDVSIPDSGVLRLL